MRMVQLAILGLALETSVLAAGLQSSGTEVEAQPDTPRTLVASRLFRREDNRPQLVRRADEESSDTSFSSTKAYVGGKDSDSGSGPASSEEALVGTKGSISSGRFGYNFNTEGLRGAKRLPNSQAVLADRRGPISSSGDSTTDSSDASGLKAAHNSDQSQPDHYFEHGKTSSSEEENGNQRPEAPHRQLTGGQVTANIPTRFARDFGSFVKGKGVTNIHGPHQSRRKSISGKFKNTILNRQPTNPSEEDTPTSPRAGPSRQESTPDRAARRASYKMES